jgi:hypothetical protein
MEKRVSDHVILYLDILGYQDLIGKCDNEDFYLQQVSALMSGLANYINDRNKSIDGRVEDLDLSRFQYRVFSDNIVFFAPVRIYDDPLKIRIDRDNLCNNLLYGLSEFLFTYNKSDIFFRGAITCGKFYHDNNSEFGLIFGSGLIRAHYLENDIAVYPRIVIDECFNTDGLLVGLGKDFDGIGFLDFLTLGNKLIVHSKKLENGSKEAIEHNELYVHNFSESLLCAIRTYKEKAKIYQKYAYLANHFNRFCLNNGFTDYIISFK